MAKQPIVFFGSGPVAAASLSLLTAHCDITAVITKPTTLSEMQAACPPAPIFTIQNKAELDSLLQKERFDSQLAILIDFGIIVSQEVIDYFPLGIINSHFSLLPQLRGADPISFAILSGQKQTGVSLMLLTAGMDEGPILSSAALDINEQTGPELTDQLVELSDSILKEVIPLYTRHEISPIPQESAAALHDIDPAPTYSRKLTKDDGIIDWTKPAEQIEREIRAFIQWPKSRAQLGSKDVIITKAHAIPANNLIAKPGDLHAEGKSLIVACGTGSLSIDILKPAGKKEMPIQAFLAGNKM